MTTESTYMMMADNLNRQDAEIDRLTAQVQDLLKGWAEECDELRAELAACDEYRKDGESVLQCIERNRQDWIAATKMLATERATNERLRDALAALKPEEKP